MNNLVIKKIPVILLGIIIVMFIVMICRDSILPWRENLQAKTGEQDIDGRFSLPVICIEGDEEDLFGYEKGILVPGKLYDEAEPVIKEPKDQYSGIQEEIENSLPYSAFSPANFNLTEELRNVVVYYYEPDGTLDFKRDAIVSIAGNSSRKYDQKPLKLELASKVELPFCKIDGESMLTKNTSFKNLRLRNCGVDFYSSRIRNFLTASLARKAGFEAVCAVQPVSVYINGKYYGMMDLQPDMSRGYISDAFGIDENGLFVVSGEEEHFMNAAGYKYPEYPDFTNPTERADFEKKVDVEDLLRYYAFSLVMGNGDWPQNNFRAFMYNGSEIDGNKYTDGRFRFLMYDFDSCLEGCLDNMDPFENLFYASRGNAPEGMETDRQWVLLSLMMEYKGYENEFVNNLMELTEGVLSTENMLGEAVRLNDIITREMEYNVSSNPFDNVRWAASERNSELLRLYEVIQNRTNRVHDYIYQYFGGEQVYDVKASVTGGNGSVMVGHDTAYQGKPISTKRCAQAAVRVFAQASPGYEAEGLYVNGKLYSEGTKGSGISLVISENDIQPDSGMADIEFKVKPSEKETVVIEKIAAKGEQDIIVIKNTGVLPVDLSNYTLSDNWDSLYKWRFPKVILQNQEEYYIYGKNSAVNSSKKPFSRCNFALKNGESVILAKNGEIKDNIPVLKMETDEWFGRFFDSGNMRFFDRKNDFRLEEM